MSVKKNPDGLDWSREAMSQETGAAASHTKTASRRLDCPGFPELARRQVTSHHTGTTSIGPKRLIRRQGFPRCCSAHRQDPCLDGHLMVGHCGFANVVGFSRWWGPGPGRCRACREMPEMEHLHMAMGISKFLKMSCLTKSYSENLEETGKSISIGVPLAISVVKIKKI